MSRGVALGSAAIMADRLTPAARSRLMGKVRGADTKPEWILRCGLHRRGFRYVLGGRRLPGRPDLVFPRFRAVVFVHGCFWHRHAGCRDATTPKSNADFWQAKFAENVERDSRKQRELERLGWRVRIVWECDLQRRTGDVIDEVAAWIDREHAGAMAPQACAPVARRVILAVAERNVRERIATYTRSRRPRGARKK